MAQTTAPDPMARPRSITRRRRHSDQPRLVEFKIRFSTDEHVLLCRASGRQGMAPRAWAGEMLMRCAADGAPPPLASWQDVIAAQLAHRVDIVRAGTVINQVAKVANSTGRVPAPVERLAALAARMLARADALVSEAVARQRPGQTQ